MHETEAELQALQALLERSIELASTFLRSSFEMPAHSLSAAQLVNLLRGRLTVALSTVTASGEPRVAPIAALFLHGRFFVPTVAEAVRARHIARRPPASLTYFEGTELAVIAHGHGAIIPAGDPAFAELDAAQVEHGGQTVREWEGHGVYLELNPDRLYTYAREPSRYRGYIPPSTLTT